MTTSLSPAREVAFSPSQSWASDAVVILFHEEALMRNLFEGLTERWEDAVSLQHAELDEL